jgi:hypothetical protein
VSFESESACEMPYKAIGGRLNSDPSASIPLPQDEDISSGLNYSKNMDINRTKDIANLDPLYVSTWHYSDGEHLTKFENYYCGVQEIRSFFILSAFFMIFALFCTNQ